MARPAPAMAPPVLSPQGAPGWAGPLSPAALPPSLLPPHSGEVATWPHAGSLSPGTPPPLGPHLLRPLICRVHGRAPSHPTHSLRPLSAE